VDYNAKLRVIGGRKATGLTKTAGLPGISR
jgi:hypothetical protein